MASQAATTPIDEPTSVFQSDLPLETKLERARTELLDLSARNRLLNMPRSGKATKALEIIDEQTAELYRLLVKEQRALTFLPGRRASEATEDEAAEGEEIAELAQPDDDGVDERGIASRHADTRLQTRLTPAGLQKRLLDLYYDARTLEEEQGVNILFLALGSLKWVDPANPKNVRYAPLILIPVGLERGNAAEKFKLRWRQEDIAPNLSLEAMLDRVHGLKLPTFEAGDDFDPARYIAGVAEAVSAKSDWSVQTDDVVLGFFSFAKFLMYRDLDPANWPVGSKLSDHDTIRSLVSDGFDEDRPLLDEDTKLDGLIKPDALTHIVDSDSSQSLAVHEVRRGRSLVIQGPPGTGKSQTIANLIGAAVADGKTVLFVAEKMAALEVVKRRLDNNGVGDICLELHSNKANKKAVLAELDRTWQLGAPRGDDLAALNARLDDAREELNAHAERLHRPSGAAEFTPYQAIGHLVRLRQLGHKPTDLALEGSSDWTQEDLRVRSLLVDELAARVGDIGVPAEHTWRGVRLDQILPIEAERLGDRIVGLLAELRALRADGARNASRLELGMPATLAVFDEALALAVRIAQAPSLDPAALGSALWSEQPEAASQLLGAGESHAALRASLGLIYEDAAWSADLSSIRATFANLPASFSPGDFEVAAKLKAAIPAITSLVADVARLLGRSEPPTSVDAALDMLRVADRVAAAPDADVSTLGATLWETGIERAGELAAAVQSHAEARSIIGDGLSDAGWNVDLAAERRILAAHGTGFFRLFSGEWRRAARTVRSYLTDPKAPLDRQLAILDAQARVQVLSKKIEAEHSFGEAAFGNVWRGAGTPTEPLHALVEWMRSLKGLGAEPRIVAGRSPDKLRLAALVGDLSARLADAASLADHLMRALGEARPAFDLPESGSPDFQQLSRVAGVIDEADAGEKEISLRTCEQVGTRLSDLHQLQLGQDKVRTLEAGDENGRALFGEAWRGSTSDWPELRSASTLR